MNTSHLEADRNQEMVDLSPRPTPALLLYEWSLNSNWLDGSLGHESTIFWSVSFLNKGAIPGPHNSSLDLLSYDLSYGDLGLNNKVCIESLPWPDTELKSEEQMNWRTKDQSSPDIF